MAVHENLVLHIGEDKFYIEARDQGTKEVLVIDRLSQEIVLESSGIQIPTVTAVQPICGVIGTINLLAGHYLVIITKKRKVGEIKGETIWKITSTEIIPYRKTLLHLSEIQQRHNRVYEGMIQQVLDMNCYYFSTTYDLTHTLQRLYNTSPEFSQMALHERADQRFVWNCHLLRELSAQPEVSRFILPVMCGFVSVKVGLINSKRFEHILVSRRSCFRAGTRFYMRGLDDQGHAANFVETEQIIQHSGNLASFVQTRGSIPLFWTQRPNIKYKPTPQISKSQNHLDAFHRHIDSLVVSYGMHVLINLIDHKGAEKLLEDRFAKTVYDSKNEQIRYESFDFHHECRKMQWHRLSILTEKLSKEQEQFGYFMVSSSNELLKHQIGVFRTNCIDCLDRTNVVQSLLARRSLYEQMQFFGILKPGERIEEHQFDSSFNNVWADNADECSKQYAGTGALKTDFTRTGKRTKFGLLKDGFNSAVRYYKNNFSDGTRQDAIDLFLGNYIVEDNEGITFPSPLEQQRDVKYLLLPLICVIAFSMTLISVLMPPAETFLAISYFLFWLIATTLTFGLIYIFGLEYVDAPRLCQSKIKVD
ncbi:phosphatidylinositol-3-phosphatase SAC1-like [Antedon mediterranea]|uniref:phosphatidylinositol-3-phosphatase SAC1-like n=1 Tax=Antedon mediterranea TaxID=105859 RepID=UPI003AF9633A